MSTEIVRVKKAGLKAVRKIRSHVVVGYIRNTGETCSVALHRGDVKIFYTHALTESGKVPFYILYRPGRLCNISHKRGTWGRDRLFPWKITGIVGA